MCRWKAPTYSRGSGSRSWILGPLYPQISTTYGQHACWQSKNGVSKQDELLTRSAFLSNCKFFLVVLYFVFLQINITWKLLEVGEAFLDAEYASVTRPYFLLRLRLSAPTPTLGSFLLVLRRDGTLPGALFLLQLGSLHELLAARKKCMRAAYV